MNINADLCGDQTPHLHTTLSLTSPPPPPVIYIYIELDAVVESEWRQPRLIIMGDYGPTAPPLCRVITKRVSERGGWGPLDAQMSGSISFREIMSLCFPLHLFHL